MVNHIFQPSGADCSIDKLVLPNSKRNKEALGVAKQAIRNANPSKAKDPSLCPIHHLAAIPHKDFDEIYSLLQQAHGFNPWVANEENKTALTFAYEGCQWNAKQLRMISALIIKGSDYPAQPDVYGFLPLHYACLLGLSDAVQHFINKGTDLTLPVQKGSNFEGDTPLQLAIKSAHNNVVIILINEGKCPVTPKDRMLASITQ